MAVVCVPESCLVCKLKMLISKKKYYLSEKATVKEYLMATNKFYAFLEQNQISF